MATLLVLAAAFGASAGDEDVAGVWKRPGDNPQYYVIEAGESGLTGRLVNPPFEGMSATLDLKVVNGELRGQCNWEEKVEDKTYNAFTLWELKVQGDTLKGRCEGLDWEDGVVHHREWLAYTLERVARRGLVTEGEAGEAGFGEEFEGLTSLAGGWSGPGGAWTGSVSGEELVLSPVGHHDGASIRLKNERGTLRGEAKLADGTVSKLELGLNEGALSGRSSWNAGPVEGWSPVSFSRVERLEASAAPAPELTPAEGSVVGVWKRDDGLYLRLRAEGEGVVGVLSDATGTVKARATLRNDGGIWRGAINWGDYETKLELALAGEGLAARAEWADVQEGKLVATGWSGRSFKRLARLN